MVPWPSGNIARSKALDHFQPAWQGGFEEVPFSAGNIELGITCKEENFEFDFDWNIICVDREKKVHSGRCLRDFAGAAEMNRAPNFSLNRRLARMLDV